MTTLAPGVARGRARGVLRAKTVTLAHGGGGKAMRDLVDDVFVSAFAGGANSVLEDQARLPLAGLAALGDRLAFTTDSFVVSPLFFPGGDIGTLAVCGTVNDLAVCGAKPLFLSCGVIIEEGLDVALLRRVVASMQDCAAAAGVAIVTGDTKVVERGACDRLFVNTAGIGVIPAGLLLGADRARPGDAVLVNGWLGDHGATILAARGDLALETSIASDCAALHGLVDAVVKACPDARAFRDATRGGVAAVLNEIAEASQVGIELDEKAVPLREEVRGFCEILGLDPLYLANEGKLVCVVPAASEQAALRAMRGHPLGAEAAIVGHVAAGPVGLVVMDTIFGGRRVVDMLIGEQLPRIC